MSIVETRDGKVAGAVEDGAHVFRGIPFAQPPVGPLRFAPPQPPEPWAGVRPATEFGPVSHQTVIGLGFMGAGQQPHSEDCLYLNVWTPAPDGARRPVMVWVHGGAFVIGAGSEPLYDGRRLALAGDVVVVTVNYRLGALGYLGHPSLRDEATGAWANWGLLDQIEAVRWVRDNAAAFGGDPDNITVFGESAGSMSVTTMMAAPAARGLFRRVIGQSGAPMVATAEEAEATAGRVLHELGVGAGELRSVPAERFVEVQQAVMLSGGGGGGVSSGPDGEAMPFRPVVDGAVLPRRPREAVAAGVAAGIGLLTGTNRDETKLFSMLDQGEIDDDALLARLGATLPADACERVVEVYRKARSARGEPVEAREIWSAIETDRFFRAAAVRFAADHARHEPQTYLYLFDWSSPIAQLGAAHAIEVPFVFATLDAPMIDMFAGGGPDAERLSKLVQGAWVAFARTGDPSTADLGAWPAFDGHRRTTMVLGREPHVEDSPRSDELACWLEPAP